MTDTHTTRNAKAKSIGSDVPARTIYDSLVDAMAALETYADYDGYDDLPKIVYGLDAETGEIDASRYPDGWPVYLVKLSTKITKAKAAQLGVEIGSYPKALVVWPVPDLDTLLADDAGRAMVAATMETQLNHRLVAPLRDAENVSAMVGQMPATLAEWTTVGRDQSGSIYEVFNAVWPTLNKSLRQHSPVWAKASLGRTQARQAMESKAFAETMFPALEQSSQGPVFVFAIQACRTLASHKGLDTSLFDAWLETRDQTVIAIDDASGEDDVELSLDNLFDFGDGEDGSAEDSDTSGD